jgi:hypothetical protein
MARARVPTFAWALSGATAVGLVVAAVVVVVRHGWGGFYKEDDAHHYVLIAQDLFGRGRAIADPSEAAYRYGRFGLPFLGWLFAFGRPAGVEYTLVGVNLAAIAAIPGLASTLLHDYGVPAVAGAVALVPVGLYELYRDPVADPLMIGLVLLALVLDARGRRSRALVTLACAVLVKEVAALALVPWMWHALRHKEWRDAGLLPSVVVPYAFWCIWVRLRVGQFPFLAHTVQRTEAFGAPAAGIRSTLHTRPPFYGSIVTLTVATIAVAFLAAYVAHRSPLGALAGVFGVLTLCLGPNALRYSFEIGRLLAPAQVFAVLALAVAWSERRQRADLAVPIPVAETALGVR